MIGAWYPLLPYSRSPVDWTGMQFHRADLQQGVLLVFRHAESPYRTADLALRGLEAEAMYEVVSDSQGMLGLFRGERLMQGLTWTLSEKHSSDLLVYSKK